MAPHSSTLAWKIPWAEEPGRLQSTGSLKVRHDWATSLWLFTSCIGERNGNPLQCFCLENPRDRRAWWAAVYGIAQSWTRLKRLILNELCCPDYPFTFFLKFGALKSQRNRLVPHLIMYTVFYSSSHHTQMANPTLLCQLWYNSNFYFAH